MIKHKIKNQKVPKIHNQINEGPMDFLKNLAGKAGQKLSSWAGTQPAQQPTQQIGRAHV